MKIIISLEELCAYLFVQNLWTLLIVDQLLFCSISRRELILGCLIGTFLEAVAVGILVSNVLANALKWAVLLMLAFISVWAISGITYRIVNWKGRILVMSKFMFTSSVVGAGYTALELMLGCIFPYHLFLLFIACGTMYLWIRWQRIRRNNQNDCTVWLRNKAGKSYTGLWDTGNLLLEPISKWPVCIIKKQYLKEVVGKNDLHKVRAIPYQTVNGDKRIMYGFPMDVMEVEKEGIVVKIRRVYLAATEGDSGLSDYDILLPNYVFDRRGKGCL